MYRMHGEFTEPSIAPSCPEREWVKGVCKKQKSVKEKKKTSGVRKPVPSEHRGKWGFVDAETGEEVVPFIYDAVHAFSAGMALVRVNGWWGYVDSTGKEVIPCIYYPAWSFTKTGLAAVCIEGKCGFIDRTGREVIPLIYEDARYFRKDGRAQVKRNGETFFIDEKGNRVD
jgi:hypothetical protein